MAFRVGIDPVALRQIDQFAVYLRDYSEDFAIEQIERLDCILSLKRVKPAAYRTAAAEFRAALIAQGIPVHQVDEGTQSSNVIDGPFKRQDVDDTDDDVT
jgi:hypothetical protein